MEVRVVKRGEYDEDTVRWAEAIVSAGGKLDCADEMENCKTKYATVTQQHTHAVNLSLQQHFPFMQFHVLFLHFR